MEFWKMLRQYLRIEKSRATRAGVRLEPVDRKHERVQLHRHGPRKKRRLADHQPTADRPVGNDHLHGHVFGYGRRRHHTRTRPRRGRPIRNQLR